MGGDSAEEREMLKAIVESLADGVFTTDRSLQITHLSHSLCRLVELEGEEVLGHPCREVLRGSICGSDCPLQWTLRYDKGVDCSEWLVTKGKRRVPIVISTAPLRDGEGRVVGVVGTVKDRSGMEELRREVTGRHPFGNLVGKNHKMLEVYNLIETVADSDATILIEGESGTGKDLVTRAIHQASYRRDKPFVKMNCSALAEGLLESELFGHVKGAFTGAIRDKPGKFELAQGGTVFLDEIGETSPSLQVKLLRVLQDKEFERVGGERTIRVNVRVIAATNKVLREEIARGRFRDDLYYRLCVVPFHLPPLRERKEDIPLLVEYFLERCQQKFPKKEIKIDSISPRALGLLLDYDWPGNIRELENAIEHAYVCCPKGRIERAYLPREIREAGGYTLDRGHESSPLSLREKERIVRKLNELRWNRTLTAKALGMSRTHLWRKMRRYQIGRETGSAV